MSIQVMLVDDHGIYGIICGTIQVFPSKYTGNHLGVFVSTIYRFLFRKEVILLFL